MKFKFVTPESIPVSMLILLGVIGFLPGCATQPLPALEEARQQVQQLRNDPAIADNAPVALYDAEKSLKQADQLWESTRDRTEAEHLAYLTKGKAAIAKYNAQRKAADAQIKDLENARKKLVLAAREQEVAEAHKKVRSLEDQLKALQAKKTDRGLVITIGDVLFDTAKANLKAGALNNLYRLVTALREYDTRNVLIEGHTDSVGSDEYNLDLSQRRAQSVADFLMSNGIAPSRIVTRGYGEAYPVSTNSTAIGRQYNRRVEVVILNEGDTPDKFMRR